MAKSKTYTLYLIKDDVTNFEDVFTETALERIHSGDVDISNSNDLGQQASVYVFQKDNVKPSWLDDLNETFSGVPKVRNKSSCAVIIFKQGERLFVTPFAHGWQYINDTKIVSDFGLMVTINSLSDDSVKRVDRSHLGEAMKGVSQSAFKRDLQAFGIDEALDLVRKITGRTKKDSFANSLAGSTPLKVTKAMELSQLGEVAEEALSRFISDKYKTTGFNIIDKVRPILDPVLLDKLNSETVKAIKDGKDNFELAMPGWSEDDVVYYGMYGPGLKGRFPDLMMSNYIDALGSELKNIDIDTITTKHGVFAEFNNDAHSKTSWSIKKALIGSLTLDSGLYAINEGEWYRLDEQFKNDIEDTFQKFKSDWEFPPEKIIQKVSADGKKTGLESELDYNIRSAKSYDQVCLDQEIVHVPSIPYGKFEACDLLDIENKKLIHVKKSSRQSSVLSHFFKQGMNSAKILKFYPEAQEKLIEVVENKEGKKTAEELRKALGDNLSDWTVEFHIIDSPRKDGEFKIPFFSRVTLRDEARSLIGMSFNVSLKFIPH